MNAGEPAGFAWAGCCLLATNLPLCPVVGFGREDKEREEKEKDKEEETEEEKEKTEVEKEEKKEEEEKVGE